MYTRNVWWMIVASWIVGTLLATTASCQTPSTCGNHVVNNGEDCDIGTLNNQTCQTLGLGFAGGQLACGIGCKFDMTGCYQQRFEDTGQTIIDHGTGLEWEKKVPGTSPAVDWRAVGTCLHCVDDVYPWLLAMGDWLSRLNGFSPAIGFVQPFAGHADWRLPDFREYSTLLNCPTPTTCQLQAGFGPDAAGLYWSSETYMGLLVPSPYNVWFASSYKASGGAQVDNPMPKFSFLHVRAVRGTCEPVSIPFIAGASMCRVQ